MRVLTGFEILTTHIVSRAAEGRGSKAPVRPKKLSGGRGLNWANCYNLWSMHNSWSLNWSDLFTEYRSVLVRELCWCVRILRARLAGASPVALRS